MEALLLDLINYAQQNGLVEGDGVDSFRDFVPEDPDNVVVFNEYRGEPLEVGETITNRSVQVLVRNKSADDARALAVALCKLFQPSSDDAVIHLSSERWAQIYIRQTPFKLKQDESDRVYYCFNLGITTSIE